MKKRIYILFILLSVFISACTDNDRFAVEDELELAGQYFNSGDLDKAFKYFFMSANKGNPEGLLGVGVCYLNGLGVSQNYNLAVQYIKSSANKGNADALFILGNLFFNGLGVEQNQKIAFSYYSRAANKGNLDAKVSVGVCYLYGTGVNENSEIGFRYLDEASAQGHPQAASIKLNYRALDNGFKKAARQRQREMQNQGSNNRSQNLQNWMMDAYR